MLEQKPITVDFLSNQTMHRLRTSTLRDPLLRALGFKKNLNLNIIDATAGFGSDALLMAYHGARVVMLEREPQMAALLQAGLALAQNSETLGEATSRLTLIINDAKDYLVNLHEHEYPDVIYLDPMFVHKKSALPNKQMQFLQNLVKDHDADELLKLALTRAHKRVVIKRSIHAPYLGEVKPDMSIKSKLLRFDVFMSHASKPGS